MYEEYLEFAVGLARQAGAIQMESFRGGDLGVEAKSNLYDVVTRVTPATRLIAPAGVGGLRPVLRGGRLDRRFLGAGSPRVGCSGR